MALDGMRTKDEENTSRRTRRQNAKEENFINVKGRKGIPLFIGSKIWHLKRCDQSKNDT